MPSLARKRKFGQSGKMLLGAGLFYGANEFFELIPSEQGSWVAVALASLAVINSFLPTNQKSKPLPRSYGTKLHPKYLDSPSYPGDFKGKVVPIYTPNPGQDADPGEIIWTWVPYEEDFSQGKDRPVLLIGKDGDWLLGLMLTSQDNTAKKYKRGRWLDIGTGPWDKKGRPSEVRLDRVVRIWPSSMRREGAVMPRDQFHRIASQL